MIGHLAMQQEGRCLSVASFMCLEIDSGVVALPNGVTHLSRVVKLTLQPFSIHTKPFAVCINRSAQVGPRLEHVVNGIPKCYRLCIGFVCAADDIAPVRLNIGNWQRLKLCHIRTDIKLRNNGYAKT